MSKGGYLPVPPRFWPVFYAACSDGEHHADAHDERRVRQEGDGSGGSDGRAETPDTGAAEGSCSIVRSYGAFTLTESNTGKMASVGVALYAEWTLVHKGLFTRTVTVPVSV